MPPKVEGYYASAKCADDFSIRSCEVSMFGMRESHVSIHQHPAFGVCSPVILAYSISKLTWSVVCRAQTQTLGFSPRRAQICLAQGSQKRVPLESVKSCAGISRSRLDGVLMESGAWEPKATEVCRFRSQRRCAWLHLAPSSGGFCQACET